MQMDIAEALLRWTERVQQYPDYGTFHQELANFYGLPTGCMSMGAGSEELIKTLIMLSCNPGDMIGVLPYPTCAMFDIYAKAFGAIIRPFEISPAGCCDSELVLGNLRDRETKIMFLVNPGQIVQTYFLPYQIKHIADQLAQRGCLLVVDEAHHGFGADTCIPLIVTTPNLVVLRTFSKMYGAASIRVGCALAQSSVIRFLDAVRQSGEVTGPSMEVVRVLMRHKAWFERDAARTAKARDWLVRELEDEGFAAYGKYGFSVLIEMFSTEEAIRVGGLLTSLGVCVKYDLPRPVAHCLFLALGDMDLARAFLVRFKSAVAEARK